jgi:ATP-binding cassette subfamily F protein uup
MASGNLPFEELQQLSVRVLEVEKLLDQKELRWLELSDLA